MAKTNKPPQVVLKKCEACGAPLPVNDRGMPATSLYFNGHWLGPCHKFDKDAREMFK